MNGKNGSGRQKLNFITLGLEESRVALQKWATPFFLGCWLTGAFNRATATNGWPYKAMQLLLKQTARHFNILRNNDLFFFCFLLLQKIPVYLFETITILSWLGTVHLLLLILLLYDFFYLPFSYKKLHDTGFSKHI
jgi:hypothetical protein